MSVRTRVEAPTPGGDFLLEREHETATLGRALRDAAAGSARVALVEGPAGIGKSRLLAALRADARDAGFTVLSARGTDLERAFPFGVVRQLFEPYLATATDRERCCSGAAAAAPIFDPPDLDAAAQDASFAALHGLYWLTLNVAAENPVALIVDDLHWSDVPSLRFLAYLVRRLDGQAVLIAGGVRTTDPGAGAVPLSEISADPLTVAVRPAPLTVRAVHELVAQRLGADAAPEFVSTCLDVTGGNPLLLRELLKTLAVQGVRPDPAGASDVRSLGSQAISGTVRTRLTRCSPAAVAVARALAVVGEGADIGTVAALAELDERQAAAATRELTGAEILRPEPPVGFVHPLVGDAVYRDLAAGEREVYHARAADLLRTAGAPLDQVAAHWLVLPRRGEQAVAEALREAGRIAMKRGAPESAGAYLRRALQEPLPDEERACLLLELGTAETDVNVQQAATHTREAYAALRDPTTRAVAAEILARQVFFTGTGEEAATIARDAIAELPPGMDDQRQRLQAMQLVAVNFGAPEPDMAARLERLRGEITGDGAGAKMLRAVVALESALLGQPSSLSAPLALDALEGGTLVEADPGISAIAAIAVLVLAEEGEPLEIWEEIRGVAHRRGSLMAAVGLQLWRGWTLLQLGEIDDAHESLRQAADAEASWVLDTGQGVIYTSAFLARALLERDDPAGARRALGRKGTVTDGTDGGLFGALAEAEILCAEGRPAEAVAILDAQCGFVPRVDNPAWLPWRPVKATALAALRRTDEAVALLQEELERARTWGAPMPIGRALRVLGKIEGPREDRLLEAVAVLEGSACRLELAKALAALGRAMRLARRPGEARAPLARALEIAASCGATALVEHVRSEIYATGARPRATAPSGAASLTPSELRVARLAIEGRTNRDIAQALYVTPKTVEVHLSSAYRKLGIASRAGLAGALAAA